MHVVAENAVGRSPPSKVLTVTTDDEGYFSVYLLHILVHITHSVRVCKDVIL